MSDRSSIGGLPIALAAALVLSGCNGGGGGGDAGKDTPTSVSFTIVPQSASTLTSYFVQSFEPFEAFAGACVWATNDIPSSRITGGSIMRPPRCIAAIPLPPRVLNMRIQSG